MATIEQFKGVHRGKRVFILASGPSLKDHDLSRLDRRLVIGLNRSALAYPNTHYHCTMDQRLFDEFPDVLGKTRYLFTLEGRPFGIPLPLLGSQGFSWDLAKGIYSGYTIAYFALQIAVYMGFAEVFFLGLDLKNQGMNTHFFGHDFRSSTHEQSEYPRMTKMLIYAAKELKDSGVKVYNCSPVSALDCFPKMDFDEAVSL